MRKTGKIIDYSPYEAVTNKDGQVVMGQDGLALMKRTVVIDCSYESEDGHSIRDIHVCDTFKDIPDEQLAQWRASGETVAAYIFGDGRQSADGRWFAGEKVTNIKGLPPAPPKEGGL